MTRFILFFLKILILFISLQSWIKADDISDFEIEGMSIGESALKYFSEDDLIKHKEYYQNSKSKTFFLTNVYSSNFQKYDNIMFHFKDNDPEFIIHSISGGVYFGADKMKDVKECMKERNEIDKDFKKIFKNADRDVRDNIPHSGDPTGKSFEHGIYYWLKDDSLVAISCNDYSESFGGDDHFKVVVYSKEFAYWLSYVAYE